MELDYNFIVAIWWSFKTTLKREAYGWAYGSAKAGRVYDDYATMMLMGGEL